MKITPLRVDLIPQVTALMKLGEPYIRARTYSDYWAYSKLFSSTCLLAITDTGDAAGAVMAFRSQDNPCDVYVQDVITHPDHRQQGVSKALITAVRGQAANWGCARLYLTSEPDNAADQATWRALGFVNVPGDRDVDGVSVTSNFKGPGKHRVVYELTLP